MFPEAAGDIAALDGRLWLARCGFLTVGFVFGDLGICGEPMVFGVGALCVGVDAFAGGAGDGLEMPCPGVPFPTFGGGCTLLGGGGWFKDSGCPRRVWLARLGV